MKARRGYTLAEVLLAASLALVVLGAVVVFFRSLLVSANLFWAGSSSFQQLQIVDSFLSRQISTALASSLTQPNPSSLAWVSSLAGSGRAEFDSEGQKLWQAKGLIYLDGTLLRRRIQSLASPVAVVDPSSLSLNSFTPSPTDAVLASDVVDWTIARDQERCRFHLRLVKGKVDRALTIFARPDPSNR